jgi:translation initiation factor IF-3
VQRAAENRINDRIRAPKVRLIGADGSQVGIVTLQQALQMAQDAGLDVVEVAPNADPPVCKVMDYGKFKYQESIRAKEARKKQGHQSVKEIRFGPKIGEHDYLTKKNRVTDFLDDGHRVKVSVRFKGREMHHTELGTRLLRRLSSDLAEVGTVEVEGKLDGRIMSMMFSPVKKKPEKKAEEKAEEKAESHAEDEVEPGGAQALPPDGDGQDHAPDGVGVPPVQVEDQAASDPAEA